MKKIDKINQLLFSNNGDSIELGFTLCKGQFGWNKERVLQHYIDSKIIYFSPMNDDYIVLPDLLMHRCGSYFHGKLQDDLGSDIVYIPQIKFGKKSFEPGIHEVKVNNKGILLDAIYFYWLYQKQDHGLITYPKHIDYTAYNFAYNSFKEETYIL